MKHSKNHTLSYHRSTTETARNLLATPAQVASKSTFLLRFEFRIFVLQEIGKEVMAMATNSSASKAASSNAANSAAADDKGLHQKPNYILKYTLKGHTKGISSVKFSPDGKWLASACKTAMFFSHKGIAAAADCTTKIWHAQDGRFEQTLEGHTLGISDISWSSDSKYICSASDDKTIKIWDISTVSFLYRFELATHTKKFREKC